MRLRHLLTEYGQLAEFIGAEVSKLLDVTPSGSHNVQLAITGRHYPLDREAALCKTSHRSMTFH
jgi:hypothetical protein